jgi:transposase
LNALKAQTRRPTVEHIAIDLGGRKSQVCVRSPSGEIVAERRLDTQALAMFLLSRPPSRVILETCAEAFHIADHALAAGHEVRVVPSTLVRSLGVGARGIKTDQRDAQALSEVSTRIYLPSVYIPQASARQRAALCSSRQVLVSSRTKLINHCRGWLRTQTGRIPSGNSKTFPARMRKYPGQLPEHIEAVLQVVEQTNLQIKKLDGELEEITEADELCKRLMTVPGVGPMTALRFSAAIGDIARFGKSHALESYLGLVPGERSSGDKKQRTTLTKAGNVNVRWLLTQAAWSAWRSRSGDPMVQWAKRVALRRGNHVAVIALARKIAGILYAIWRDGTRYDPSRGAEIVSANLRELQEAISG